MQPLDDTPGEQQEASTYAEVAVKERRDQAQKIIEAMLFTSSDPVSLHKITEILSSFFPYTRSDVQAMIQELSERYRESNSAFQLYEIAGGYLLRTAEIYRPYIEKLLGTTRRTEKLSAAATEVLAIVAHRQPVARAQIDSIRGVDCSNSLHVLLDKGLIEQVGRAEAPGRPPLYGVTERFLKHFGLNSLKELPKP